MIEFQTRSALVLLCVVAATSISACGGGTSSQTDSAADGDAIAVSDTPNDLVAISDAGGDVGSNLDGVSSDRVSIPDTGSDIGTEIADTRGDSADVSDSSTPDVVLALDVQPVGMQTVQFIAGQPPGTVMYTATVGGNPVNAQWTVDRAALGSMLPVNGTSSTFTPTGAAGGSVNITATYAGQTVQRQLVVVWLGTQNGVDLSAPGESTQVAGSTAQLSAGGGVGGVGGEGLGSAVTDTPTVLALQSPGGDGAAQGLALIYPYDSTVWPQGMLAPLLMWAWSTGDADAVRIQLATTSGTFHWVGTFGRPAILAQTGGSFIRHPIPQDVWDIATNSAGIPTSSGNRDALTLSMTVARGGQAYGPITQTWNVAPGRLAGTTYYTSYGTQLLRNSNDTSFLGTQYGAGILSLRAGESSPRIAAGAPSALGTGTGCRACHTASSDGSTLLAQHGDMYNVSSLYDLKTATELPLPPTPELGWAGISPDGTLALTNAADLSASSPTSQLYALSPPSTTPLSTTGIPSNLQAGTPTFSRDGRHVAFDFIAGTIGGNTGNGTELVALDFDASTRAFSNLQVLATVASSARVGFPSFFPTNDAVVFQHQIISSNLRYSTWHGATAQIWWSDLATGSATRLSALNGLEADNATPYLPNGPNNHGSDTMLNYEPSVSPVPSGGYIWVVFTSRRLYGNVAITDPWQSDPRAYDARLLSNATTKKLWVCAIDLNAAPGTDPSHPAFYLPAQELLAANFRGNWVLDPCAADGQSCQSGDQCCGGYCEASGTSGTPMCQSTQVAGTCAAVQERCSVASDCCDANNLCLNGYCTLSGPG